MKSDEAALPHRPPFPPKKPHSSPHLSSLPPPPPPPSADICQGPRGVSASSGSRPREDFEPLRCGSRIPCSTQRSPAHAGQIQHKEGGAAWQGPAAQGRVLGERQRAGMLPPPLSAFLSYPTWGWVRPRPWGGGRQRRGAGHGLLPTSQLHRLHAGATCHVQGLPVAGSGSVDPLLQGETLSGRAKPWQQSSRRSRSWEYFGRQRAGRAGNLAPLPGSPRGPSAGPGGDRDETPAPAQPSEPQRPERGGGAATRGLE